MHVGTYLKFSLSICQALCAFSIRSINESSSIPSTLHRDTTSFQVRNVQLLIWQHLDMICKVDIQKKTRDMHSKSMSPLQCPTRFHCFYYFYGRLTSEQNLLSSWPRIKANRQPIFSSWSRFDGTNAVQLFRFRRLGCRVLRVQEFWWGHAFNYTKPSTYLPTCGRFGTSGK